MKKLIRKEMKLRNSQNYSKLMSNNEVSQTYLLGLQQNLKVALTEAIECCVSNRVEKNLGYIYVAMYHSLPNEIDVLNLFNSKSKESNQSDNWSFFIKECGFKDLTVKILLPRMGLITNSNELLFYDYTNEDDLEINKYGIKEPRILDSEGKLKNCILPDIVITPLVAFYGNNRLGYGKGCYDQTFNTLNTIENHSYTSISLAYSFQDISQYYNSNDLSEVFNDRDQKVNYMITEKEVRKLT